MAIKSQTETQETVVQNTDTVVNSAAKSLTDESKVLVKALVPSVYYTCSKTYESFSWTDIGDTQEMTYLQLRIMKTKYPRYFTEKWLMPCDDVVLKKLKLQDIFVSKLTREDMKKLYGNSTNAAEELLNDLTDGAREDLSQKVVKDVKSGKISNIKIIRLLEKYLNLDLMQHV